LNNEAPCEFPNIYPTQNGASDGGPLPQTVPSENFTVAVSSRTLILSGKGWGHGVGMSQWGARFMADAGNSATAILKHFYGPAQITTVKEPGQIRVLAAEGLHAARISIEGPVRVRTETGSVLAAGKKFEVTGGKTFTIRRGIGPSLKPVLTIVPKVALISAPTGETIAIPFTTSRSARVRLRFLHGGMIVTETDAVSLVSGDNEISLPLRPPDEPTSKKGLDPGEYKVLILGFDGLDHVVSAPVAIQVEAATPTPTTAPRPAPAGSRAWIIAVIAVLLVGIAGFFLRRRVISRT
jgi:hypothetical protein